MKSIRLLLLLASGVTTGAFAQSGGLTDMSQSRFAKMANTELGACALDRWLLGRPFQCI